MTEFKSPLKTWPGSFTLPDPDDFSGVHWKAYKDSVNKAIRAEYIVAETHRYGYSCLEFIADHGSWNITVITGYETEEIDGRKTEKPIVAVLPLPVVRSWETNPDEERTKLIAWIGREFNRYMMRIVDPKE